MKMTEEHFEELRHGRHCVFLLQVQLVFVTKYRHDVFSSPILADLRNIFASVCEDFESELLEFDGEHDFVRLQIRYPPKVQISSLVNSLKCVSSRLLRRSQYTALQKKFWASSLWSPSYFASSMLGCAPGQLDQFIEDERTVSERSLKRLRSMHK